MVLVWPEEGSAHAARMLRIEAGYLNRDFAESEIWVRPAEVMGEAFGTVWGWGFERSGLADVLLFFGEWSGLGQFVEAMLFTLQVFVVRCLVLFFSLPVFALFLVVGLATGLSMRDVRRWSAGREYGGLFHKARRWPRRVLLVGCFVYLSIPIAVHPTVVVLPSAVLLGAACCVATALWKKYW